MARPLRPASARASRPLVEASELRRPQSANARYSAADTSDHLQPRRPQSAKPRLSTPSRGAQPTIVRTKAMSLCCAGSGEPMTAALHAKISEDADAGCKEQLLRAAIVQLAPSDRVSPCRSGFCCWRWAARTLLDECTHARRNAHQLQEAFKEELGDSVLQKFLDLQQSYEELRSELQAVLEKLEKQQASNVATETRLQEAQQECEQEVIARERGDAVRAKLEKDLQEMVALVKSLETELVNMSEPRERLKSMTKKCEELEARTSAAEAAREKLDSQLRREIADRQDLMLKLKHLEAIEANFLKARQKKRREAKGAQKRTALRPALR